MPQLSAPTAIPLYLQPQSILADARWPTHAAVALPRTFAESRDAFGLFEAGRQIPAQIVTVATWPDGRPKWLHVHANFSYVQGRPLSYELRKLPSGSKPLPTALSVVEAEGGWTIDTGKIRFRVGRQSFSGLRNMTVGSAAQPLFESATGGPYLIDGAGHVHAARHDREAVVVLEDSGPCQVTLRAEGWYQPERDGIERFARFTTRIIANADSEVVRFEHLTAFAAPMNVRRVADIRFEAPLPCGGAKQYGMDGKQVHLAASENAAWFHQESADRCRATSQSKSEQHGRRLDGWFAAESQGLQIAVSVRDYWEKFPNEIELGPDGIIYHLWPRHGRDTCTLAEQLDPTRINQFVCFHQGKFLELKLPDAYFDALAEQLKKTGEEGESRPESLRDFNGVGIALSTQFALRVAAESATFDPAQWHAMHRLDPIVLPSPEWTASSEALGSIAAKGSDFPEIENFIESGLLAYSDPARLGDYGKFNYGDTHSKVFPAERRASLHRNWFNNHYLVCSTTWTLVARGGSADLLAVARRTTDHLTTVDQVRGGAAAGCFWHKGLYHWGGAGASTYGHWCDPTGLLLAWLIDADRSAKDGYELWRLHLPPLPLGVGREVNSSLVYGRVAYDYTHDEKRLSQLRAIAQSLQSQLPSKQLGPLWNPQWISQMYSLLPSPASADYVLAAVQDTSPRRGGIMALCACVTAYDLTHDQTYLTRMLPWLARLSRRLYHVPESRWSNFGFAPGPAMDEHLAMQWPFFLAALRQAGIDKLPKDLEPGCYPQGTSRHQIDNDIRGCTVLALKADDAPFEFELQAAAISNGDMQPALVTVFDPSGSVVLRAEFPGKQAHEVSRPSGEQTQSRRWTVDGARTAGLYQINVAANQLGIFQPLTNYPEAAVLKNRQLRNWREPVFHATASASGHLLTLASPICLTFSARGNSGFSRVRLIDAHGKPLLNEWLMLGEKESASITFDARPGAIYYLDVFSSPPSYFHLEVEGPRGVDAPLLFGQSLNHLRQVAAALPQSFTFELPPVR